MYDWKWYETRIAELFSRVEGAIVEHNVHEKGSESHTERQIDIRVLFPMKIDLGQRFEITIPIKIIVDCKAHNTPLDIKQIEEIIGLKNDVKANLAVAVSPLGVSQAGKERAKSDGVYPITVTGDLIALLHGFDYHDYKICLMCDEGLILMDSPLSGNCDWCNGLYLRCPDCHEVIGIGESQYDVGVKCGAECGTVFFVPHGKKGEIGPIKVYSELECMLMTAAYSKSKKTLSKAEVSKIISKTKWQHYHETRPELNLTELGLMEWHDDSLHLTDDGKDIVENVINKAESPDYY